MTRTRLKLVHGHISSSNAASDKSTYYPIQRYMYMTESTTAVARVRKRQRIETTVYELDSFGILIMAKILRDLRVHEPLLQSLAPDAIRKSVTFVE